MNTKRILSMLVALIMAFAFCVGCSTTGNENNGAAPLTDEQIIEKNSNEFWMALLSLDYDNAISYVKQDSSAYQELSSNKDTYDKNIILDSMIASLEAPDDYKEPIKTIMSDAIDRIMEKSVITVSSVSIDGNKATVSLKMSIPDSSQLGTVMGEINNYLTEEEIKEIELKTSRLSGKELDNYMWDTIVKILPRAVDAGIEKMSANATEDDGVLVFEKTDDKWLIVGSEE